MYTVSTQGHFDAAHFLKGYPGKCSNLHGHRWTIVAKVVAEELTEDGMVVDFKDLKHDLRDLCEAYDHSLVYEAGSLRPATLAALHEEGFAMVEVPFRPTAENLAKRFFDDLTGRGHHVVCVAVYETPDNVATYEV